MPEPFRILPQAGPEAYRTYGLFRPKATHTRPASCAESNCRNRERGWRTTVDVSTALGAKQANYIRLHSGRAFTHEQNGTLVAFTFAAGQDCFTEHRAFLERMPLFKVKGGDFRGNPLGLPALSLRPADWVDHFAENLDSVRTTIQRG